MDKSQAARYFKSAGTDSEPGSAVLRDLERNLHGGRAPRVLLGKSANVVYNQALTTRATHKMHSKMVFIPFLAHDDILNEYNGFFR